ncbi:MAG: hypothetical protein QW222_02590 [Candidatus Bathyarchaeia archaeon]
MVSKDQAIGGLIFAVCVIVGILYTIGLFYFGKPFDGGWGVAFWLIAIPVFLAFIVIMGIGAWIGWTMATTPPPKPIEEITSEIEGKKEEEKTEEKTLEAAEKAEEETSTESAERKKKNKK